MPEPASKQAAAGIRPVKTSADLVNVLEVAPGHVRAIPQIIQTASCMTAWSQHTVTTAAQASISARMLDMDESKEETTDREGAQRFPP